MKTRIVCAMGIAFVLVSVGHATYQAHYYTGEGTYYEVEYASGDAHLLFSFAFGDCADCDSTGQIWVVGNEWGETAACSDGCTGVYITDYDPQVDPPLHLSYTYDACAFVNFATYVPGSPGSGSGQSHGYIQGYRVDAALSYSGLEFDVDSQQVRVNGWIPMSYNGARYEAYGVTYADLSLAADNSAEEIRGHSTVGFYEMAFAINEW